MADFREVLAALDELYPPTNPAVLLAAARDAYLNGVRHREIVKLLSWTLSVIATNVPGEVTSVQREAINALYFAWSPPYIDDPVTVEPASTDTTHECEDGAVVNDADVATETNEYGEHRCSACGERILVDDEGWTNREGQPEFNGAFGIID